MKESLDLREEVVCGIVLFAITAVLGYLGVPFIVSLLIAFVPAGVIGVIARGDGYEK